MLLDNCVVFAFQVFEQREMPKLPPPGRNFGSCQPGAWSYHELPASSGGVCLDGSPFGFYYMPAVPNPRRELEHLRNNDSWLLYFEGGGWCFSPEDCALRADTRAGSSVSWEKRDGQVTYGGIVNKCCFCTRFCRFHRIFLKSCDGHAFAGDANIAAVRSADGQRGRVLHSAGQAILRGVINVLAAEFGIRDAKSVLVAGCSAGGMAALLNAERIRSQLRAVGAQPQRFKVAAISGLFFPARVGVESSESLLSPFEDQVRALVHLGKVALPARCSSIMPIGQEWRCLLSTGLLDALPEDLPAFVYQSRLDLWQTNCILAAGRSRYFGLNCSSSPAWHRCLGWMQPLKASARCSPQQWATLRAFEEANDAAIHGSASLLRPGYGSFVHSCYDHCASTSGLINTGATLRPGTYNDSINLREALHLWFATQPDKDPVPAWNHSHTGCWNAAVAASVPGKANEHWCRRPECAPGEKMHKDDTAGQRARIRSRGWKWFLDEQLQ